MIYFGVDRLKGHRAMLTGRVALLTGSLRADRRQPLHH